MKIIRKLLTLFSQFNEETTKLEGIIEEINSISNQLKGPFLDLDPEIEQLNTTINSMKSKITTNINDFKTNEINENKNKSQIKKIDNTGLKIHIGFKNPLGEVHTFEAHYGTTMDKLLSTYFKTLGMDPYKNNYYFEYNEKSFNLGDMRRIEQIFSNVQEPTVLVKQYETHPSTDVENQDNVLYQENNYNYGY